MRFVLGALLAASLTSVAFAAEPAGKLDLAQAHVSGNTDLVTAALKEEMAERQYVLTAESENELHFARPVDNAALRQALGGLDAPLPQARVIMLLAPGAAETTVYSSFSVVTHPGTAEEQTADVNGLGLDPRLQDMLNGIDGTVAAIAAREVNIRTALADTKVQ